MSILTTCLEDDASSIDARLRMLDIDDLYLLKFLGDGKRLSDTALALSLTRPAITHRVHKIEQALSVILLERKIRGTNLTKCALSVCQVAENVIQHLDKLLIKTIS